LLAESRKARKALRADGLSDEQRKARSRKIKESTAARIREMLTPDQRARYDQLSNAASAGQGADGHGADGEAGVGGRVWVLDADGEPQPVALRLGMTDGTATEVLEGDLTEGQAVIVGFAGPQRHSTPTGRLKL